MQGILDPLELDASGKQAVDSLVGLRKRAQKAIHTAGRGRHLRHSAGNEGRNASNQIAAALYQYPAQVCSMLSLCFPGLQEPNRSCPVCDCKSALGAKEQCAQERLGGTKYVVLPGIDALSSLHKKPSLKGESKSYTFRVRACALASSVYLMEKLAKLLPREE